MNMRMLSVIGGAYVVFAGATLLPLAFVSVPPLVDYPVHLARMWILLHGHDIPALADNYTIHWRLLPYLAMDLIVPVLGKFMPIELAGRIFVAGSLILLVTGTVVLHKVLHGHVGYWPMTSCFFLYNAVLFWGMVNCLFAMGMFLLAFAGWIATEKWQIVLRFVVFSLVAAGLWFLHLFAFGLYGLAVGGYELGICLRRPDPVIGKIQSFAVTCLQFVPGLLLWIVSLSGVGSTYTSFGSLSSKLYALVAPTTFGFVPSQFELLMWLSCGGFFCLAWVSGWLKFDPRMRLPLAFMVTAAALMPNWLSGSWGADIRLPVILPFIVIAATRLEFSHIRGQRIFAVLALSLLALRIWSVSAIWRDADRHFSELRRSMGSIAPGGRLLSLFLPLPEKNRSLPDLPSFFGGRQELGWIHAPVLAVLDRSVYMPDMVFGWMTIDPSPRNAHIWETANSYDSEVNVLTPDRLLQSFREDSDHGVEGQIQGKTYWDGWPSKFDYIVWLDYGNRPIALPPNLQSVAAGSFFHIYRIRK